MTIMHITRNNELSPPRSTPSLKLIARKKPTLPLATTKTTPKFWPIWTE